MLDYIRNAYLVTIGPRGYTIRSKRPDGTTVLTSGGILTPAMMDEINRCGIPVRDSR